MDEELEKLKSLVQKATANYDAQVKKNEALETQIKGLNDKLTDLTEKLNAGDPDAKVKMEELADEISDLREKQKTPILAVTDADQKNALREVARKAFAVAIKSNSKTKGDILGLAREQMDVEIKALNVTTPAEGGYAVAEILSMDVMDIARGYSPISSNIMYKTGITRDYRQLIRISWPAVAEGIENVAGAVPAVTDTQEYAEVKAKEFKLYASPYITNEALNGVDIDVYSDLTMALGEEIGVYLANQLLFGDGLGKNARGMLSTNRVDITDVTGESWKATGTRNPDFFPAYGTGVSGAIGIDDQAIIDFVIDVTNTLPTRYLGGAAWYMNRKTKGVFQKVRDLQGRPIFQYDYIEGLPGRRLLLEGYPVIIDDTMPDLAANSLFAIFGNMSAAFAYNDGDIDQMLLDPYTKKGGLLVYTEKEYFEMVQRSDAILVLAATTNDDKV
jgi:HK97 family phage major capsid protein